MRHINGELIFKVHKKPISNDRYLNFISCNLINQKVTIIKALQRRAYTVCSDVESKTEELNTVRKNLLNNGYQYHMIDKCEEKYNVPFPTKDMQNPAPPLSEVAKLFLHTFQRF